MDKVREFSGTLSFLCPFWEKNILLQILFCECLCNTPLRINIETEANNVPQEKVGVSSSAVKPTLNQSNLGYATSVPETFTDHRSVNQFPSETKSPFAVVHYFAV